MYLKPDHSEAKITQKIKKDLVFSLKLPSCCVRVTPSQHIDKFIVTLCKKKLHLALIFAEQLAQKNAGVAREEFHLLSVTNFS